MSDFDQLGTFYLGRRHDLAGGQTQAEPLVYDSKDLTTHAVCVGMTGSGKTGLCTSLLEEAALDGIPAIVIDPKGDLGNLLLAFPNLAPSDFRPWVDESEAARRQMSVDEFAANQAETWRNGLAKWDEGPERIRRYCDAVERVIYTPGSNAGIPIAVLKSFHAPSPELVADSETFGERIASATSGLLALMGIEADPVRSREHILLSNLLDASWRAGRDLDLRQLIQHIQRPPFDKIGVIDLESFYPAAERYKLAMSLNNLLASPSFANWLEGEPLDIGRMLYSSAGKPRLAIFSIAHLDEAQRMFFVTLLLNEVLAWVRTQPGTSSLRALLYMDEVFGYFPPIGNPPAKRPMLTLLKQARAYGLGCVLATQNPVDLDYKGLSNAGTWFLGRLQTERDKARVIEGLEGASTQAGATFNRQQMEATLAALGKRVFLMNNVHDDAPVVFHTRWAMSYLCGPLTRSQIKTLMDPVRANFAQPATGATETLDGDTTVVTTGGSIRGGGSNRPVLPAGIHEAFATIRERVPDGYELEYRPALAGKGKVHFVRKGEGVDVWRECFLLQSVQDTPPDDVWKGATALQQELTTESQPDDRGRFADLPSEMSREKSYAVFGRHLREHLYREETLKLFTSSSLNQTSKADEKDEEFRDRLTPLLETKRNAEREKLEKAHAAKLADAEDKIRRAKARLSTQRWQFLARIGSMLWVIVDTIMSALGRGLPGRRRSLDPAFRSAATERGQQSNAQIALESALQHKQRLEEQHLEQLKVLEASHNPANVQIESLELKPQKADIEVDKVSLVWLPWRIDSTGAAAPVY
ncbi:MAG: DUF87 domain-containing protein [Planctomycetes bacterium]|nr:DUF87 domain-containing protein [Planctomycetota bacterium]